MCETRHGEGGEILHGFEDGAKGVLNGREVDLGTIVLVIQAPNFVVEDATNPGLSGFEGLGRYHGG